MKNLFLLITSLLILSKGYGQGSTTTTTTTTTSPDTVVVKDTVAVRDAAVVATPVNESSSSSDYSHVYIGGRLLATFTALKLRNVDNSTVEGTLTLGYGGGGVLGVNLSRNFALQLEVLYSSLAQKYKDFGGIERELKLSYVNIPLLLMLNTDVSKSVNFNICAGPQIGFNVGSSLSAGSGSGVDTVNAVLAVKAGDIGIAYGAGLDFSLTEALKLNLGFRGVQGLLDISDNSKTTTTNEYYLLDRSHVNTYSGYIGLTIGF